MHNLYVCSVHTCVQWTLFYTSPRRTDRSTAILQCSLKSSTLIPKYIPYGISFLTASRFLHRTGLPSYRSAYRYSASASPIRPNRYGPRLSQPMRPMLSLSLNKSFAHKAYLLQSYCDTYKDSIFPVVVTRDKIVGGMLPPATWRPPGHSKTKRICRIGTIDFRG